MDPAPENERPPECRLPAHVAEAIQAAAREAAPNEGCGLLIGDGHGRAVRVLRATVARNIERARPRTRYELHPEDLLAAELEARAEGARVLGVWHSHPGRPAVPSRVDARGAWPGWWYLIATTPGQGTLLRGWWPAPENPSGFEEGTLVLERAPASRRSRGNQDSPLTHKSGWTTAC